MQKPTKKKEVLYKADKNNYIVVGQSAFVLPVNHPYVQQGRLTRTSEVVNYDKTTGTFETQNSHYVLLKSI